MVTPSCLSKKSRTQSKLKMVQIHGSVTRPFKRLRCGGSFREFGSRPKHPYWTPHYSLGVFSKGGCSDPGEWLYRVPASCVVERVLERAGPLGPRKGRHHPVICPFASVNEGVEQFWKSSSSSKMHLPRHPEECDVVRQRPLPFWLNKPCLTGPSWGRMRLSPSSWGHTFSFPACLLAFLKAMPSLHTRGKKRT